MIFHLLMILAQCIILNHNVADLELRMHRCIERNLVYLKNVMKQYHKKLVLWSYNPKFEKKPNFHGFKKECAIYISIEKSFLAKQQLIKQLVYPRYNLGIHKFAFRPCSKEYFWNSNKLHSRYYRLILPLFYDGGGVDFFVLTQMTAV